MNLSEQITQLKRDTEAAKVRLLKTFTFVPDDRLQWSPTSTARTALQIVAHCGTANRAFAAAIRGEKLPLSSDPKEAAAQIRDGGKEIQTREAAVQSVEDSTAEVLSALDTVTTERMESKPDTPFGPIPFTVWINIPADHMSGHTAQIDYLQTIWGDQEDH
jgi:uncharacterized damage-inducible protein DinB